MSDDNFQIMPDNIINPDCSFKIIVIGDSSVGKSCLTLRGTKDKFKDFYTPTIGFEFLALNIKINNKIIRLQIWDTCGQEIYRSLISSFYRNSTLAIVVYAIDNQESFDNLDSWLDEIKCQTHPNLKIFLIGNKMDLEENRVISKEKAETFYSSHNLDYFIETSAKTGENAQKVFVKAAQVLYDEYLLHAEKEKTSESENKSTNNLSLQSETSENGNEKEKEVEQRRRHGCGC